MDRITSKEFETRLGSMCLQQSGLSLPRKRRDQMILFKSVAMAFRPNQTYTESNVNATIERWLGQVGRGSELDHVSLRRHLVDEGFLERDAAGVAYRVVGTKTADLFDPAIDALDPQQIVENARALRDRRKHDYLDKAGDR